MSHIINKFVQMIVVIAMLSACVSGTWPKNPQEFVQYYSKPTDTYVVDKSFAQVSKIWTNQAGKCLNGKIVRTYVSPLVFSPDDTLDYRTYIHPGDQQFELSMKYKFNRQLVLGDGAPKDGFILSLVARAKPEGNKTRVNLYRQNAPHILGLTADALKAWASGKTEGCPDMTQD